MAVYGQSETLKRIPDCVQPPVQRSYLTQAHTCVKNTSEPRYSASALVITYKFRPTDIWQIRSHRNQLATVTCGNDVRCSPLHVYRDNSSVNIKHENKNVIKTPVLFSRTKTKTIAFSCVRTRTKMILQTRTEYELNRMLSNGIATTTKITRRTKIFSKVKATKMKYRLDKFAIRLPQENMTIPVSTTTASLCCVRSSSRGDLMIPRSRLSRYGSRGFAVCGPAAWNSLPAAVHNLPSSSSCFCSRLKTELFARRMALIHRSTFVIA